MKGITPLKQNEHNPIKPKERSIDGVQERVYVGKQPNEEGYIKGDEFAMSDKPMYEEQDYASHLMADDGDKTAWPTLFLVEGVWYDTRNESTERQMEIAKQQGELYTFDRHDQMVDFAREGNWKNK